jgi:hypothetical protein
MKLTIIAMQNQAKILCQHLIIIMTQKFRIFQCICTDSLVFAACHASCPCLLVQYEYPWSF